MMKKKYKTVKKINNFFTVFYFFSSFFKTVKKLFNFFTVFFLFFHCFFAELGNQIKSRNLCRFNFVADHVIPETSLLVYFSPSNWLVLRRRGLKYMQSASLSVRTMLYLLLSRMQVVKKKQKNFMSDKKRTTFFHFFFCFRAPPTPPPGRTREKTALFSTRKKNSEKKF
jgi:hypothetical protein